jgi:hypothetical protein
MRNVDMVCDIDLLVFADADGKAGIFTAMQFDTGQLTIRRRTPTTDICDPIRLIQVRSDGALFIGYPDMASLSTEPGIFRAPLTVIKLCLYLRAHYAFWGHSLDFTSTLFQWPAAPGPAPGQRQWLEGSVVPDIGSEDWMPDGSQLRHVWGLRAVLTPDGQHLVPGALRCRRA